MTTNRLAARFAFVALTAASALSAFPGCASTSHATTPAALGVARSGASIEAVVDQPGPVTVQTVVAAEWEVPRSGLLNLDHPAAKAAGLVDGPEPIQLFVHVVRHPTRGTFLVDTGVERAFIADPGHAVVHGLFASLAHVEKLKVHEDTAAIVAGLGEPVQGVLLTHLHMDHVMGMRDVPASVPVYVGAGDAEEHSLMNVFQKGVYDAALEGKGPLREVRFAPDPDGEFEGVLDVFGDGTLWAIWVPGHTPGSIAYLARTPAGPVLLVGDASHTAWGWQHGVEPGSFSDDRAKSAESLARLERFVVRHPAIDVRLGHQQLAKAVASR
jgi:glyoxylase-like metal-dependent hydrolase (beta-lactamase superfamily II)